MKQVFFVCSLIFLSVLKINAQNDYYEISLKGLEPKKAFQFYKQKIGEIIELNIEKTPALKNEILLNFKQREKDSTGIGVTYWLNKNGKLNPYLFGSSIKRNTSAFLELKNTLLNISVRYQDVKKIVNDPEGKQIKLFINFRKEKGIRFLSIKTKRKKISF